MMAVKIGAICHLSGLNRIERDISKFLKITVPFLQDGPEQFLKNRLRCYGDGWSVTRELYYPGTHSVRISQDSK